MKNYFKKNFTNSDAKLSYDEDKLIDIINEKWITKNCSLCGINDWTVDPDLIKLSNIYNKNESYPLISITCNNCGNTILINPLAIKIIK